MNQWGLCLQYCFGPSPLAPPSIKLLLDDPLVVNLGETITLVCVVTGGDPPPTLKWVRPGGKEVPKRSVVNRGTLTIPAVTLEDGGTYSCMASNNVGNPAKKSTNILVRGTRHRPRAPSCWVSMSSEKQKLTSTLGGFHSDISENLTEFLGTEQEKMPKYYE